MKKKAITPEQIIGKLREAEGSSPFDPAGKIKELADMADSFFCCGAFCLLRFFRVVLRVCKFL